MKIANSGVSMTSSHVMETHVSVEKSSVTLMSVNDGAAAESSAPAKARTDAFIPASANGRRQSGTRNAVQISVTASEERTEVFQAETRSKEHAVSGLDKLPQSARADASVFDIGESLEDVKASILRKMLELLTGTKGKEPLKFGELTKGRSLDLRSDQYKALDVRVGLFSVGAEARTGTTSAGTLWKRVTETSVTRSESEATTFQSQGFAVTEDGRALQFDVSFSMSRSFTSNYDSIVAEDALMTDPLIINLDSGVTTLSDAKFSFDLDSDGQTEEISFAGQGSGFLALDANGNGVIDDGSELFGTQSGDGFADLAAHDDDGNGWIDENDAVYENLRVWTKDAQGNDKLMNLKEANVGAIYLDSVRTEFSLKDAATNETNGVIRRTGVYLKETGEAGTLSHVDLRS